MRTISHTLRLKKETMSSKDEGAQGGEEQHTNRETNKDEQDDGIAQSIRYLSLQQDSNSASGVRLKKETMSSRDEGAQGGEQHTNRETNRDEQNEGIAQSIRYLSLQQDSNSASGVSENQDEADHFLSDLKDAWPFGQTKVLSDRPDAEMPVSRFSPDYNMKNKRRGFAVIIAYSAFKYGGPGRRDCAPHDAKLCKRAFEKLHYDVRIYENLPRHDFFSLLEIVRDADHKDCDSLVVVFMSHGGLHDKNNEEFIWTYDAMVKTSKLWEYFTPEKCPSLAGKPKMFFIQACRGDEVDKGVQLKRPKGLTVEADAIDRRSDKEDYAIPLYADMLMMWASYPGMFAFKSRNHGMNGSVFIHFLTKVLTEDAHNEDLFSMLVRVTREVAIHYESYVPGDGILDKNKQIPQIVSTLMRKINFL